MSDLDSVFDETPKVEEETATPEVEAAAETDETEGKGEQVAETPAADKDEEKHWSHSAYLDEKRKRQELQEEIDRLKKPQEEEEEAIDPVADPEGYQAQVRETIRQETLKTRIEVSAQVMRSEHPDYEEKESKFIEMAKSDPSLVAKMNAHRLPAQFVYDTVSKQLLLDEIGDPVAYRKKIEDEIRAELAGKPEAVEKVADKSTGTPSLANVAASGTTVATEKLQSLSEMFSGSPL